MLPQWFFQLISSLNHTLDLFYLIATFVPLYSFFLWTFGPILLNSCFLYFCYHHGFMKSDLVLCHIFIDCCKRFSLWHTGIQIPINRLPLCVFNVLIQLISSLKAMPSLALRKQPYSIVLGVCNIWLSLYSCRLSTKLWCCFNRYNAVFQVRCRV